MPTAAKHDVKDSAYRRRDYRCFQRHYRRFYLKNALDRDERNEVNLYKVDQLTAMRWYLASWNEISQQTIENCFHHTGLFEAVEDDRRVGEEYWLEQ